jgi:hypothetical protein
MVITGTLPGVCYAEGMTSFLKAVASASSIALASPSRCASESAPGRRSSWRAAPASRSSSLAKAHIRKEEVVARVLEARGEGPGLVHLLSAMEACTSYRPWHDKASGKTSLNPIRVNACITTFTSSGVAVELQRERTPGWHPQVEQAEHRIGWLARKLRRRASASPWPTTAGATRWGAFVKVSDLASAQQLADRLSRLDHYANSTNNMQKGKEGERGELCFCMTSVRSATAPPASAGIRPQDRRRGVER